MDFILETEYIELFKLLKATNLVGTGGEGKIHIENEEVKVNGAVETRKRYKSRVGDVIEFSEHMITIKESC